MDTSDYDVKFLPVNKVYSDDVFNCRGPINPAHVTDLATSIRDGGLKFPIAVQPACDVEGGVPDGFDFRIIAGHRRFKAFKVLGRETVPSMIKVGLSELEARIFNLEENLLREDLNILQEANALKALKDAGLPRDHTAKRLKKSSGWVQARYYLLDLPPEVQQEAAAGLINQFQIKQLHSLKSSEEQYAAVRKIKEMNQKGLKVDRLSPRKKKPTNTKKPRSRDEIFDLMELMGTQYGYGLHTRALAWASGEITTDDLFQDITDACVRDGKTFYPPREF